jgi:hypothetical protein
VLVVDDSEIFQRVGASLVSDAQGLHLVGVAAPARRRSGSSRS